MKPRAPFIWLEPPVPTATNGWFLFRRTINLGRAPEGGSVKITVDGRYQLFVNGERIGRGPPRANPAFQQYDEYDLAGRLSAGSNVVGVLVHTYGVDTGWYEVGRDPWTKLCGFGALWVEFSVFDPDGEQAFDSDEGWRVMTSDAWAKDTPRIQDGLGFIEVFDARLFPRGWLDPEFDDADWKPARRLDLHAGAKIGITGLSLRPFPVLIPRRTHFLSEWDVRPCKLLSTHGLERRPRLPVEDRAYEEPLVEAPARAASRPEVLTGAAGIATLRTGNGVDLSVLLEFETLLTGYPYIEFEAEGGETIELLVSENLPGAWTGQVDKDTRIVRAPLADTTDAHICRIIARPGLQRFERFEWDAVRWMQLVVRDAPKGIKVHKVGVTATTYPVTWAGCFSCSDPLLDKLWEAGAYTVQLCMHDAWEDCPSREQRQWLGDAAVEHLVGQAAFGPSVVPLNANYLRQVAESQEASGLTGKFAPGDYRDNMLGAPIPDWTLQWILNAGDHWQFTADIGTIEAIFPSIQKALAWFDLHLSQSGLVADLPYWHFMDWADFDRGGESCAVNAQLAGCLDVAAHLAEALESWRAARKYRGRAAEIRASLHARHWDEVRGCFVDRVDPRSGAQGRRVSQHANAAMILWGDVSATQQQRMVDRMTDPRRLVFTAAPPIAKHHADFDDEQSVVLANTFYAHFVYGALFEAGAAAAALDMMRERLGPMIAKGSPTLWESLEPSASLCHGFSASPTWHLSSGVLGVTPIAPGYARARFAPQLGDLSFAKGCIPTPFGNIDVSLERTDSGFDARLGVPEGLQLEAQGSGGFLPEEGARLIRSGETLRYVPC